MWSFFDPLPVATFEKSASVPQTKQSVTLIVDDVETARRFYSDNLIALACGEVFA